MGAKVRIKLDALKIVDTVRDDFKKSVKEEFGSQLINSISKGVNPVSDGQVKQPQYSESYKKAIKKGYIKGKTKISPVDLKQNGALLNSLVMNDTDNGVRISFTDDKAFFHNDLGVGKNKIKRRMLPTNDGETFSSSLFVRIKKFVSDSVKKYTKK